MLKMTKSARIILWIFMPLAILLVLAVAIRIFTISLYVIPQSGMLPNYPPRQHLVGLKRPFFDPDSVQTGDIVVFEKPKDDGTYLFIWRVIALSGDTVETRGAEVKVNGVALTQTATNDRQGRRVLLEDNGRVSYRILIAPNRPEAPPNIKMVVPPGHFFAMGDNRFNAYDSRYTGTDPLAAIRSKIIW